MGRHSEFRSRGLRPRVYSSHKGRRGRVVGIFYADPKTEVPPAGLTYPFLAGTTVTVAFDSPPEQGPFQVDEVKKILDEDPPDNGALEAKKGIWLQAGRVELFQNAGGQIADVSYNTREDLFSTPGSSVTRTPADTVNPADAGVWASRVRASGDGRNRECGRLATVRECGRLGTVGRRSIESAGTASRVRASGDGRKEGASRVRASEDGRLSVWGRCCS